MESLVKSQNKENKRKIKYSKISIGLPIYNAEKLIRQKIENLLEQTFIDFELIISDNASTDDTVKICKEFMKKDSRIKLYEQDHNIGQFNNFNFVLEKSSGEYFAWTAADDLLLPEFLEKNLHILETKKNVVTSVSRLRMFGNFTDTLKKNENDSLLKKIKIKILNRSAYMDCFPVSGKYEDKVTDFLKNCRHSQVFYGLHRCEYIKKCIVFESFIGFDTFYALSLLRYGDIHVIDDILMEVSDGGDSRKKGMIGISKMVNEGIYRYFFPWLPITTYSRKNIGTKLFLKNINFFIKLNISGLFSFCIDVLRKLRTL
ncbi:glycosyltransferase family 2 protein [Nitrosopumilus sp.]|nr:glycosyltransferase family 2 protein [Nitrosopumilus sp.]